MADSFKSRFPSTTFELDGVQLCISKFSARIQVEPWFRLTTLKSPNDHVIQTIAIEIVKLVMSYPEVIRQSVEMAQNGRSLALNALRVCDPPVAGRRPVERPLPLLLKMLKLAADDHKRSKQIFHILMLMREDLKKVTKNIAREDLPSSFDWPGRPSDDAFYKEHTGGDDKALNPGRISFANFKFQLYQTHEALEELVMKFDSCVLTWWRMVEKSLLIIQEMESHINTDHSNYPFDMNALRHEWKDVKSQWESFLRTLHAIGKHMLTLSQPSRKPENPPPPAKDRKSVATDGFASSLVSGGSGMRHRTMSQDPRERVPEPSTLSPPTSESTRQAAYRANLTRSLPSPPEDPRERVPEPSTLSPPTSESVRQAAYCSPATLTAVYQPSVNHDIPHPIKKHMLTVPANLSQPPHKPEIPLSPARDRKLVTNDSPTHSPVDGGSRVRRQAVSQTRQERVAQPPTPAPPTSEPAQQADDCSPATANRVSTAPIYEFYSVVSKDDEVSATRYQPESHPHATDHHMPTAPIGRDNLTISSMPNRASPKSEPVHLPLPPSEDSRQRCITAQLTLDYAVAMELNISGALASCGISGGTYFIQVGFNEHMILLGRGALQEIYIHVNFEIPGDASPVLNELGKALSPFSSMLLTPTTPHRIPIFSKEGKTLHETEFWALIEEHGIFRRDLSMRDECVSHSTAAQDGQMREGSRHSHQVTEVNGSAWVNGVPVVLLCSDNSRGGDTGRETGCSGGKGIGSDSGGASLRGGDGRREEGSGELTGGGGSPGGGRSPGGGGSPGGGRSPGDGGPPGDGGGGGGDDPGSSSDERDRGPLFRELFIPLSAGLVVEWDQDPPISQRFSTASKVDMRMCEGGDISFPGPWFEVKFSQLQVETRAMAEIQYSLHFARVQIITSQHSTAVLDHSPHTTPSTENTFRARRGESSAHIGGITIGRNSSLGLSTAASKQSETEEVQNRSKVAIFLNAQGAPGDRVMQWDYSIDDKHEQQFGRTFEHPPPPRVKLGFELPNKPHLEIDLLIYWTMLTNTTTQPSSISRLFSFKRKKRACPPAFANLLQQVSMSIPLENLKDNCWVYPTVETKTVQPLSNVVLQCQATGQEQVRSKSNLVDLKVSFGWALHGQVGSRKELIDAPPPQPLLRSLPQNITLLTRTLLSTQDRR